MLLAIEIGLRYHTYDLYSKTEEDRTKTAVAMWTNSIADRQTDRRTQVILYLSSAMHCIEQTTLTSTSTYINTGIR